MSMSRFLIIAWIAMLAWLAVALAIARHVQELGPGADYTNADFQRCVPIDSGPLLPRRKPVLYPHNSELS